MAGTTSLTGAILAGGLGTRLQQAVPGRAKPLASVCGKPFLGFLLAQLARAGVSRVVLCTGYRSEQVRAEIGDVFDGVQLVYSAEERALGTGGALRLAWTTHSDRAPWLVMNGDSYLDVDLSDLIAEHRAAGCAASIAATEVSDGRRFGSLEWDATGRLTAFHEKSETAGARWINAGVYLLEPAFLDALPAAAPLSLEHQVFPVWIQRGLHVFSRRCRFIDIGTPESYSLAQTFFDSAGGSHSPVRHSGS